MVSGFDLDAWVAAAILFLAFDDASYVTGTLLFVDGDMTAMCGMFGGR